MGPDYQGESGLLLPNGGEEWHVWNSENPLGCLLVLACPVIKVSGNLQLPNSGRTINDPDPSGMKVWVTPPGKEPQPARWWLRAKEIGNRLLKKVGINVSCDNMAICRNENCSCYEYFFISLFEVTVLNKYLSCLSSYPYYHLTYDVLIIVNFTWQYLSFKYLTVPKDFDPPLRIGLTCFQLSAG